MKLIEKHIIRPNHADYKELMDLCHKSKNLYNAGLYMVRQYFFSVKDDPDVKYKYLNYYAVYRKMNNEHNLDFYALCSNAAQNTLRVVDQNFASFFALLKRNRLVFILKKFRYPST